MLPGHLNISYMSSSILTPRPLDFPVALGSSNLRAPIVVPSSSALLYHWIQQMSSEIDFMIIDFFFKL